MYLMAGETKAGAFTRVDLMMVVAGAALLLGLAVAGLRAAETRAPREICRSNLEEMGKAFHAWAKDHGEKLPWTLPREQGGTQGMAAGGNAWVQMAFLSNHLASPKMLACPSDQVRAANEWSRRQSGGFWHPEFRDNALSYFVGLDVTPHSPKAFLSGDRNLQVTARGQRCDYAAVRTAVSLEPNNEKLRWLDQGHGEPGNILFFDGSVRALSSEELREAAGQTEAFHADNHALWPRAVGE